MPSSPFSASSEIVILNAPELDEQGNKDTFFAKRTGTLPSGKQRAPRYTVEIRSEPLLLDLDPFMLGAKPAEAIKGLIQDQIRHITVKAQPATIGQRKWMAVEFARGVPHAMKRYAGGRIGAMAPNQSDRLFNDSGRMAEGVFVRQNPTDKTFTINLPANRDFGQGDVAMFERFKRLVPAIDPQKLSQYKVVEDAIKSAMGDMIQKAENPTAAKLLRLKMMQRRAALALVRGAMEIAAG